MGKVRQTKHFVNAIALPSHCIHCIQIQVFMILMHGGRGFLFFIGLTLSNSLANDNNRGERELSLVWGVLYPEPESD